jgi:hypothetical protein
VDAAVGRLAGVLRAGVELDPVVIVGLSLVVAVVILLAPGAPRESIRCRH